MFLVLVSEEEHLPWLHSRGLVPRLPAGRVLEEESGAVQCQSAVALHQLCCVSEHTRLKTRATAAELHLHIRISGDSGTSGSFVLHPGLQRSILALLNCGKNVSPAKTACLALCLQPIKTLRLFLLLLDGRKSYLSV